MIARTGFRTALLGLAILLPASAGGAFAQQQGADWHRTIDDVLGRPGAEQPGGVWRVGLPRTDLKVTLDGVELRPGFALGSWLAFWPHGTMLMIMGDPVLEEREVAPVMRHLAASGIEVTPLHTHMLDEESRLFFMHFWAVNDPKTLARGLRAAIGRTNSCAG